MRDDIPKLKYQTKANTKKLGYVKGGMGASTTIATRHSMDFSNRFQEENKKVLAEAREEMEIIKKKRLGQRLGSLRRYGIIKPR